MPQTGNPIAGHWWIQSMHPYRVQQASSSIRRRTGGFNPRIHTGCDNKESNYIYTRMTFQSTHPYRVRPYKALVNRLIKVSIHAPIQGATTTRKKSAAPEKVSIHAPIQGATHKIKYGSSAKIVSIHAPIQGATIMLFMNSRTK